MKLQSPNRKKHKEQTDSGYNLMYVLSSVSNFKTNQVPFYNLQGRQYVAQRISFPKSAQLFLSPRRFYFKHFSGIKEKTLAAISDSSVGKISV